MCARDRAFRAVRPPPWPERMAEVGGRHTPSWEFTQTPRVRLHDAPSQARQRGPVVGPPLIDGLRVSPYGTIIIARRAWNSPACIR